MKFYVYRHGSNSANQPLDPGPKLVATVEASSAEEATELASFSVSVYNNQTLSAREAAVVDSEEARIDQAVEVHE